jgi:hypothetical protein
MFISLFIEICDLRFRWDLGFGVWDLPKAFPCLSVAKNTYRRVSASIRGERARESNHLRLKRIPFAPFASSASFAVKSPRAFVFVAPRTESG